MKTTAIICEFNPLHSGHKRLIDYAKTVSDKVVCIMSGNFTQRGMPACCDKYSRAKHALLAGADLVVELPTVFAVASAENFAFGGVKIARELGADCLLFGSECGDIDMLRDCAEKLLLDEVNSRIAAETKKGVTYPKAVANALGSAILDKPNNVLAIEYIKAIIKSNLPITPLTIKREDNFNGAPLEFASSGALRANAELRSIYTYDYVTKDIDDDVERKYGEVAASILALKTVDDMREIEGVSEGLENRLFAADKSKGLEYLLEQIKTKRYTRMRLQRLVLNTVLNVTKNNVKSGKKGEIEINALAVKNASASLLALTNGYIGELTKRADRLYYSISSATPPLKLVKVD